MRQKIASDILGNMGTGKQCETTGNTNCFRIFRSYESKEVKTFTFMRLDAHFQHYKSDKKEEKQARRKYLILHLAAQKMGHEVGDRLCQIAYGIVS